MADRENSAAYAADERLTATILNELQLSLDAIFQRMPVKRLYQYDTLQNTLHHTNVASDEKYQRTSPTSTNCVAQQHSDISISPSWRKKNPTAISIFEGCYK